jgi:hypothetical protein
VNETKKKDRLRTTEAEKESIRQDERGKHMDHQQDSDGYAGKLLGGTVDTCDEV